MKTTPAATQPVDKMLIRDLVEHYPTTMPLLIELGLDLCCGGGHPLGEALDLHGLPRDEVLARIDAIIEGAVNA